jgi:hypothetical protein
MPRIQVIYRKVGRMKNKIAIGLLQFLGFFIMLSSISAFGEEVIFFEDFEGTHPGWYTDNGVWEIGEPAAAVGGCISGSNCAGTILLGNYPDYTNSYLIYDLPHLVGICLPEVSGDEEIWLRFWHWFSYSDDAGYVQISVQNEKDGSWSVMENIPTATAVVRSSGWTRKGIDLTPYAGKCIKIGFYHTADSYYTALGWYIDDVEVVVGVPEFPDLKACFEDSIGDWTVENGVWQIGVPDSRPGDPYEGDLCAGTILAGNYPDYTSSRLVSPSFWVPAITSDEEVHFRIWQWVEYGDDYGQIQISVQDEESGAWSEWMELDLSEPSTRTSDWAPKAVDLTSYTGKKVRIAFYHIADSYYTYAGWYIDCVEVITAIPVLFGDFELGWDGWYTDNGVWELCSTDENDFYMATVCDGNYPSYTGSRLISPTFWVPDDMGAVYFSFQHNWTYGDDFGEIEISVLDEATGEWSNWEDLFSIPATISGTSGVSATGYSYLTGFEGRKARIAFRHSADSYYEYAGWHLDDIIFPGVSPAINKIFFNRYIPTPCLSNISVSAEDPSGGNLLYHYATPDGGIIIGDGAQVAFDPLTQKYEPYTLKIAVSSERTQMASFTHKLKIYTEVVNDFEPDGDIDGKDLAQFDVATGNVARLAEEFGMVACQ